MRVRSIREVRWRQKGRFEADSGEQSVSGDDGGSICSEYGRASTRGVCLHIFVGWERRENEETGGGGGVCRIRRGDKVEMGKQEV